MRDQRVIERIRAGDAGACSGLVRDHYAAIYRMLAQLTHDAHAAEDLCQETFAAAWEKIDTFAGASSLRTWLHRIAYCRFIDWRRCERSSARQCDARGASRSGDLDPHVRAAANEQADALHATLARLHDCDREVLVLHYLNGLSYRQMAEVTGEPVGTIKWRTTAALERLGAMLKTNRSDDDTKRANQTRAAAPRIAAAPDSAGA